MHCDNNGKKNSGNATAPCTESMVGRQPGIVRQRVIFNARMTEDIFTSFFGIYCSFLTATGFAPRFVSKRF